MVVRYFSAIHLAPTNKLKCKNYNNEINIKKKARNLSGK